MVLRDGRCLTPSDGTVPHPDSGPVARTGHDLRAVEPHPLPLVPLGAVSVEPVVLRLLRSPRVLFGRLRDGLEHLRYAWAMSRLRSSVALDFMPFV